MHEGICVIRREDVHANPDIIYTIPIQYIQSACQKYDTIIPQAELHFSTLSLNLTFSILTIPPNWHGLCMQLIQPGQLSRIFVCCNFNEFAFKLNMTRHHCRPWPWRSLSRLAALARCLASLFLPLFLLEPDWRFLDLPPLLAGTSVVVLVVALVVDDVVSTVLAWPRWFLLRRRVCWPLLPASTRDLPKSTMTECPSHTFDCLIALTALLSSFDLRLNGWINSTIRRSPCLRPETRKLSCSELEDPSKCWVCSKLAQSQFAPLSM